MQFHRRGAPWSLAILCCHGNTSSTTPHPWIPQWEKWKTELYSIWKVVAVKEGMGEEHTSVVHSINEKCITPPLRMLSFTSDEAHRARRFLGSPGTSRPNFRPYSIIHLLCQTASKVPASQSSDSTEAPQPYTTPSLTKIGPNLNIDKSLGL